MKFINSQQRFSVRGCIRAGMVTGLCCGFFALSSPAPAQEQDDRIEARLRPGSTEDPVQRSDAGDASDEFRSRVEDALNGRPAAPDVPAPDARQDQPPAPDQNLGQPYYRDAQGRFFFLDPQGGRVYVEEQRQEFRPDRRMPRPRVPQGPELGIIITSSPEGIRVDQVQGTSVAAEAGIEPGDILQQVDGQRISDPRQLQRLVQSMSAGQSVEVTVLRNGEAQTLTATFPETTEGQRFGASKPPMDGAQLQREVEQLRSEVQALRRQMNRLQGQPEGATEATETEEEADILQPRLNEGLDLSTDDDETDAEAEVEAEAETSEAEQPDDGPSTL